MLSVEVSEFGPIISGRVEPRPLTVFVGRNNSGKSYCAMLLYALHRAFSFSWPRMYRRHVRYRSALLHRHMSWHLQMRLPEISSEVVKSLGSWVESNAEEDFLPIHTAPQSVKKFLNDAATSVMWTSVRGLEDEFQRCYGTSLTDLTRRDGGATRFSLTATNANPFWSLALSPLADKDGLTGDLTQPMPDFSVQVGRPVARRIARGKEPKEAAYEIMEECYEHLLSTLLSELGMFTFYFPAARSGILHSHKILASFLVRQSALVGVQRIDIPPLPGVITDFVGDLIALESRVKTKLFGEAEFIERAVIGGEVSIEVGKVEYPEIYYKREPNRYALHRTSSMVSELAPIILFLKHMIEPGDFVIIEEPESHLHPGSQRNLAWGIARLVRAGLKILITTHSDYFLNQLNNFIRLSQPEVRERKKSEYGEDAYIRPEEVGAYLFDTDDNRRGSIIRELPVSADEGIPEEEFARVATALYEETTDLQS